MKNNNEVIHYTVGTDYQEREYMNLQIQLEATYSIEKATAEATHLQSKVNHD